MSDRIWEDLARSPLDPDPNEVPSPLEWIVPLGLAAVAGLLVGLFLLGDETEPPPITTSAASTTTTATTEPPIPDPELPGGYVDIAGVGLNAVAAYSRAGNLYIVMNEATRSDHVPGETSSFHGSEWVLQGDGTSTVATRAIKSNLAPGVTVVEFEDMSDMPSSTPSLTVRKATEMVVRTSCQGCGATSVNEATGEVALDGLGRPYALTEPLVIDIASGISLSVDRLEFTDDWGYAQWHVIDANDGRVRVSLRISFDGTDDPGVDGIQPTQLIPLNLFGTNPQNPTQANPDPFTRDGSQLLERIGQRISAENPPTGLTLQWSVEWQHPVGEPITISLAGITDIGNTD